MEKKPRSKVLIEVRGQGNRPNWDLKVKINPWRGRPEQIGFRKPGALAGRREHGQSAST